MSFLEKGPPGEIASPGHRIGRPRDLPAAEMLGADCNFEDRGGGGTAQSEVVRHLLCIMELVRDGSVVFYGDGGVKGMSFVD